MEAASSDRRWLFILAALVVADVTASVETLMIMSALRHIVEEYNSTSVAGWLVSSYLVVAAASAAIFGVLGDNFGRRRMIVLSLAIMLVGSLMSLMSTNVSLLIAGRSLQGFSGAVMPLSMGLVYIYAPLKYRSLSVGILLGAGVVGAALALVGGATIVDNAGWHHVFSLSAGLTAISIMMIVLAIPRDPERTTAPKQIDWLGGLLFVPAVTALLLAIPDLGTPGKTERSLMLIAFAVVVSAVWVRHESRHSAPLIDLKLLARRDVALINLCVAAWALGPLQFTPIEMLILQQPAIAGVGFGLTATTAALFALPAKVISSIVSPVAGWLSGRYGSRPILQVTFLLAAAGWTALSVTLGDLWVFVVTMTLSCAVCVSMLYVGGSTGIMAVAPADRISEASGVVAVNRSIFQALGAQGVMWLLGGQAKGTGATPFPTLGQYEIVFAAIVVICLLGAAAAFMLTRQSNRQSAAPSVAEPSL